MDSKEEEHLPPIETKSEKCYRRNIRRVIQLRPGQKRPAGGQIKLPIVTKKQIVEINEKYRKLDKTFLRPLENQYESTSTLFERGTFNSFI